MTLFSHDTCPEEEASRIYMRDGKILPRFPVGVEVVTSVSRQVLTIIDISPNLIATNDHSTWTSDGLDLLSKGLVGQSWYLKDNDTITVVPSEELLKIKRENTIKRIKGLLDSHSVSDDNLERILDILLSSVRGVLKNDNSGKAN